MVVPDALSRLPKQDDLVDSFNILLPFVPVNDVIFLV